MNTNLLLIDDLKFSLDMFETPYAFILSTFLVLVATVSCTGHMPVIDTNTLYYIVYHGVQPKVEFKQH